MTANPPGRRGCLFCSREDAIELHHPTGRERDPSFVVPLCHDHHRLAHDDWHPTGVGAKVEPPTLLHVIAMGLQRCAMLIGRLAEEGLCPDLLGPLAKWLAENAVKMEAGIMALDEGVGIRWRHLPGMTP
jgi:hypothetical protein